MASNAPIAAAGFAFAWAVARACVQAVTIDEAETYLAFVRTGLLWAPASNNHLLNTLLMAASTAVFGVSHLSVRAPALLGCAIYLAAAVRLAERAAPERKWLSFTLFVCLAFNPLVFDFFVAARGYSLALGLLLATVEFAARRAYASSSAALALSLASNFAFAVVNGAVGCVLLFWIWRTERGRLWRFLLPGAAVTFCLSLWTVLHFDRGQLWFGAASVPEMFGSVAQASLFEVNPRVANPMLLAVLTFLRPWLLPVAAIFTIAGAAVSLRDRRIAALGVVLAAVTVIHAAMHTIAGVPLPKDRTAIYLVPLCTLLAGCVASKTYERLGGRALGGVIALLAVYYVGCLRLSYFKEWQWLREVKEAYHVVQYYERRHCLVAAGSSWHFVNSLNFYRTMYRDTRLAEFTVADPPAPGKQAYVLLTRFHGNVIDAEQLHVVYQQPESDAAVAVRPAVESANACVSP